jgi:hypothetical protein
VEAEVLYRKKLLKVKKKVCFDFVILVPFYYNSAAKPEPSLQGSVSLWWSRSRKCNPAPASVPTAFASTRFKNDTILIVFCPFSIHIFNDEKHEESKEKHLQSLCNFDNKINLCAQKIF